MQKNNFIIFSSIDWSTHWQLHHQLTMSIIKSGGRVLFVENTGVRSPKIKDISRIKSRIKSRMNSTYGFNSIEKNLTIYTPLFVPYPYNRLSIFINTLFIYKSIVRWMRLVCFYKPIVISFLPTPSTQNIIKKINPILTVYYCVDDMSRSLSNPNKLKRSEKFFFLNADLVFTTSHKIYNYALQFSDSVYNFPSGVDRKKFPLGSKESIMVPEDIEHITKPIIGYIGAIGDVFDKKLILELANTLPHINILIVGPVHTDISKLENIKNIIFIGERRHDLMSNYINSFDVALIPYIVNDATDRVYSCKLNEYLSMGKLVVSTNMYEIRIFNKQNDNVVSVGKDVKDFIDKVKKLFEKPIVESKEDYRKRVNIAKENTWDRRFAGISEAIESCLELKTESIPPWKERLKKSYRLKHRSFLKFIVYLFSLYLLIFYSPLLWYVGNQLVVRDALQQSDAIVVFSGDGEVNYRNSSYQRRALDAVRLYKSGFAADIFISSGRRQTISDVEMIRLFLINKGVPESSIHILEKYPSSTYQGVEMVSQMLYDNNINSILFLTSPYHSRRAVLTWKKNVPSIQIVAPEVIDSPSGDVQWGVEFDAMRVIGYEYTAIVHNWLDGRI